MKFENAFAVAAAIDEVYSALLDVERVAPCVPGAHVLERTGEDAYDVGIKVKVGPMSMIYRGSVEIIDRDDEAHRAVMSAKAKETRGQGTADAQVLIQLMPDNGATLGTIKTDVLLSGKAAAMGQGIIKDVSARIVETFSQNLAAMLAEGPVEAAEAPPTAEPEAPPTTGPEAPPTTGPEAVGPETGEPQAAEPEAASYALSPPPPLTPPPPTPGVPRLGEGPEEPPAAAPEAAGPETAGPEAVEPQAAEPEAAEPEAAEPETAEPEVAEPETAGPEAAEPEAAGHAPSPPPPLAPPSRRPVAPRESDALPLVKIVGPVLLARLRDPRVLGGLGGLLLVLILLRRRR